MLCDYDTADRLEGEVSAELIEASEAASPTGAVPAYLDANGCWQYVPADRVSDAKRRGETVITVYWQD